MLPSPEPIIPQAPAPPDHIKPDQRGLVRLRKGAARQAWVVGLTVLLGLAGLATIALLVLTQFGPFADAAGGCGGG